MLVLELVQQKRLVAIDCLVEVVIDLITVVAETHCYLFAIVYARSGLLAASVTKNFTTEAAVVSSVYNSEKLVAVVAVSSLTIRHPLSLASWRDSFCNLIFELSHLLY